MMGRRNRRRGKSTDSVGQDVQNESANEVITRSGKRASSKGSPNKEQANFPLLRSSSKRGSSEFDKPTPKKLSAYAQSLENKLNISRESDSSDVLIMGKSPSTKAKNGTQKDVTWKEELGSNDAGPAKITQRSQRGRSSGNQTGCSGEKLQKQGPTTTKPTTTRKASNQAQALLGVVGEKKYMHRSGRGSGNTCSATQQATSRTSSARDGNLQKASATEKTAPCDQIDSHDVRLLPDFLAGMDVAGTVSIGTDQGATVSTSSPCLFPLGNTNEVVMVLSHPQEIFLRGKANVRSLQGHVAIHGFLVRPGDMPRPFYSPNCNSLLAVGTVQLEAPSGDCRETIRVSLGNEDRGVVERILQVVNVNSVVLVFRRLDCHMCRYVTSIKPFTQLFSGCDDQSNTTPIGTLDLTMVTNVPELHMRYDDDYRCVVQQFCNQVMRGASPVVVVCGGKNVGKSTLTRYLINSALNCCGKVAFLECDVGQTEFTPSGCPALCVVTEPLLGPPFTHQRKPRRWSFFGSLSPSAQPKEYLHCVRYAYDSYARMDNKPPLVVNTMGWNKGLGIALMVETVKMVHPELIIQINSARQTKNFPYITREFLENDPGFRWSNFQVRNDANKTEHDLVVLNSPVSASLDGHEKYRPKDLRNLMLLAYFGQLQPVQGPTKNLAELQPHTMLWSAVGIHICTGSVVNSQVMYALNASVVALCIADEKTMHRSNDPTYPKFFYKTPVCQGVGFGIVRAIDPEKKVFHILTPVPQGELRKVNCLLKGDLELPEQLLLQQRSEGHFPYVGSPSDVIGASSTKKRRHMFRQRRGSMR